MVGVKIVLLRLFSLKLDQNFQDWFLDKARLKSIFSTDVLCINGSRPLKLYTEIGGEMHMFFHNSHLPLGPRQVYLAMKQFERLAINLLLSVSHADKRHNPPAINYTATTNFHYSITASLNNQ